jgi:hypothetical protein
MSARGHPDFGHYALYDAPLRPVFSVSSIKAIDITVAPVVTGLARDGSTERVKVAVFQDDDGSLPSEPSPAVEAESGLNAC